MSRYFIEVFYKGTAYSGFQTQENANTIQAEIEKAIEVLKKDKSRTYWSHQEQIRASMHCRIISILIPGLDYSNEKAIYNLNAILPEDIGIRRIIPVNDEAHCRFDAVTREYKYFVYRH